MESQEFDRMLFVGQNPTDFLAPSNGAAVRYSHHQQPPHNTTTMSSSSSSRYHVNGNGGFLVDSNNNNSVFPFMNNNLPAAAAMAAMGSQQLRSNVHDPYNDYGFNSSRHPHHVASSLNGFQETPISDDHHLMNLDFNFSRLNISPPNHHSPLPPFLTVNRNNVNNSSSRICGCDVCCNVGFDQLNSSRGFYNNNNNNNNNNVNLDHHQINPAHVNIIRSRELVRDYQNTINNMSPDHVVQARQQLAAAAAAAPAPKRTKFPASVKDIRGKILLVAKDQEGCQFLQTKCEEGKPEDIEMIFNEIKDHIRELMVDASMNYLSQKLFKVCNDRQLTHIVVSVISDDANLTNICLNSHGTRAMQKLIELVTTAEQRCMVVSALRRITITLTKNTNGHHVIQHCLKSFHVDQVQPILNVVADNCLDIATDKSGCCVLQQCVLHADGLSKQRLMTEIIENALQLAEHPYGNYVVQHILGMQLPDVTADILQKLAGNFVYLAMNKYASNVVEKCLKDAPDDQSMLIIREIANSPNFLSVIQHPFGNYVAQSALQAAKGSLKEMMINKIQKEYAFLHSHPHGKRVLALARNSRPRGGLVV